jgi:hypothetical protein
LCPKNVKLIGTICVGYPDEKPEKLGFFFSNNVLAVRIQTFTTMQKYDCIGQFTPKDSPACAKVNTFYYSSTWYPILISLKHTGPQNGRQVEKAV